MELFKYEAGLDLVHIPYRGTSAMAQSIIAGDTPLMIANLVNVMPYIRRGEITALAVTSRGRVPDLPDVPPLAETLPGFETMAWNGVLAPRGTPPAVRARLYAALVGLKDSPVMNERIRLQGGELVASTPEAFAERIRADIAQWKALAERAGIQAE
jgi:tripartite-type tricarboxylate transporter receptor subunit TctC